jgi:hypothetical protein
VEEVVLALHNRRGLEPVHHTNLLETVLASNQTNSTRPERHINRRMEHQRGRPVVLVRQINFLPAMEQEYCQRDYHPAMGLVWNRTNHPRGPEQQARIQSQILLELEPVLPEHQSQNHQLGPALEVLQRQEQVLLVLLQRQEQVLLLQTPVLQP